MEHCTSRMTLNDWSAVETKLEKTLNIRILVGLFGLMKNRTYRRQNL